MFLLFCLYFNTSDGGDATKAKQTRYRKFKEQKKYNCDELEARLASTLRGKQEGTDKTWADEAKGRPTEREHTSDDRDSDAPDAYPVEVLQRPIY